MLINADMGGSVSASKIDKVDNTDAVTSVAGRTGAITLAASDISGLSTVASSGLYSDLSGTPDSLDFQTIVINSPTTLSNTLEDGCYLIVFTAATTVTIPAYAQNKNLVFRFANFGTGGNCVIQQASGSQSCLLYTSPSPRD